MSNITNKYSAEEFRTQIGRVLGVADGIAAPPDKRTLFKTAVARICCAHFKAGDFVSVKHRRIDNCGTHYFTVNGVTVYPEHHLERFVL